MCYCMTTRAVGEEDPTTLDLGEEEFQTTMAVGEEEPEPCFTTQAVGEEGPTTVPLGEETVSTQAEGEEGPLSSMEGIASGSPFGAF